MIPAGKHYGFTLVELAIVLVIIALLVAGIMAGQSMIHNAELQSIVTDVERFKKAALLFRDKYKELPGDISTAEAIWGSDNCATFTSDVIPKITTCNGNGDGFITNNQVSPLGGNNTPYTYEKLRLWQHLANAKLIEGVYNGRPSTTTGQQQAGMTAPASRLIPNTFDFFYAYPVTAVTAGIYRANYQHIIVYGGPAGGATTVTTPTYKAALTTSDAFGLDEKIDDGYPGKGYVLSYTSGLAAAANCATTTTESTAAYKTSTAGIQCPLIFITGF
jgi:prepilin-type N-terminal cleavage/methylation domain-containing protein